MQRRKTGPSEATRLLVLTRSKGFCEVCRGSLNQGFGMSVHHRQPRGMGGTKKLNSNSASNLLVLCGSGITGCHGWIESNRAESYEKGYLVSYQEESSHMVPIKLYDGWFYLNNDGTYTKVWSPEESV